MIPIARPSLGREELDNVKKVFDTRWLGMGSFVYEFEKAIQGYVGARNAIAVNTGTTAIHLALAALGIGKGDEVIVPSLTFVGTVQPIVNVGATPVFCEVEEDTLNIDVKDAEKRITKKTRAVIPVHYGGMAADMDALKAIAKKKKISIIEDAAHAFGASYKGKMVGGLGTIACFSFDPIKNITCGEGGCITTDDDELAELLRTKRLLGINKDTWTRYKNKRSWSYEVTVEGFRYHMSNISAAIGLAQLPKLAFFLEKKRSVIREYDGFFKSVEGVGILKRDYDAMAPFNYTVKIEKDRDLFIEKMEKAGISVGVNYLPNHTQPFFKRSSVRLPVTEKVCKEIASLPLYYDITDEEITRVEDSVRGFVKA